MGIAGFPNLFNIAGPGSTSAFTNVIVAIEHHVDWIAECIAHLDAHGLAIIEAPGEMALAASALAALQPLFGDQPIAVHGLRADDKAVQYSSDLAGALA